MKRTLKSEDFVKLVFYLILISVIAFVLELFGLWQTMVLAGLIGGILIKNPRKAFFTAFLGVLFAWAIIIIFQVLSTPLLPLLNTFTNILGLGDLGVIVIFLSLLIGGILGGLGGMVGAYLAQTIEQNLRHD